MQQNLPKPKFKKPAKLLQVLNTTTTLAVIALLFYSAISSAQLATFGPHQKPDSLIALIRLDAEDTNKVLHLNALARELSQSNTDSASILASQALQMAEKLYWLKGRVFSLVVLGWCENIRGDYPQALAYLFKATDAERQLGPDITISAAFSVIGTVYYSDKDPPTRTIIFFPGDRDG